MKNSSKKSKINYYWQFSLIVLTIFFTISTARAAVFTVTDTNDSLSKGGQNHAN